MHEGDNRRRCIGRYKMKILFITLSNIGDVILTLPVLSALKDNFPDAVIDVVVGPRPKDIFAKDPKIRDVFVYDKHGYFGPILTLKENLLAYVIITIEINLRFMIDFRFVFSDIIFEDYGWIIKRGKGIEGIVIVYSSIKTID